MMSWWNDKEALEAIIHQALSKGIVMPKGPEKNLTNITFTLSPSLFPEELFELAVEVQPHFNLVIDAMSRDTSFVKETFEKVSECDSFTKSLYDIFLEVQSEGNVQTTTFGIHRMDYMVDAKSNKCGIEMELKQVEMNTISAGLVVQCPLVSQLHKYICERYIPANKTEYYSSKLPENHSFTKVVDGMSVAFKAYNKQSAYMLFVVQENEWNIFDQRHLEFDLWKRHSIPVIRRTLKEISEQCRLTNNRELFIENKEIAVVYYRAGYSPKEYPTDKEWYARKIMEMSRASNCPSVAYQLMGTKKVQQVLSKNEILEKYCTSSVEQNSMKGTFARQYSLGNVAGNEGIEMALKDPSSYVLKPQREGGGNNLYGTGLHDLLSKLVNTSERNAYVLMDRINSPSLHNGVLKCGESKATECQLISEMGIHGVFIRKGDEILVNTDAGYLMRSKPLGTDEGGVSVGIAAIDSPRLVSNDIYIKHCFVKTCT